MRGGVDVAIVGAGIVGLANAWAAARKGLKVAIFERDAYAQSASIRNFGMIWPVGQPYGEVHDIAMASRARWQEVATNSGIWCLPCGSLHLAHSTDELAVLSEYAAAPESVALGRVILDPERTLRISPAVRREGLLGALFSPTEMNVDPRQAIAQLPRWLAERYGVQLHFGTVVQSISGQRLVTTAGDQWQFERAVVASGADFQTLYPERFAQSGIRRCKLQMLRTGPQPDSWRIGPMLAGDLTLAHYPGFEGCPSLPALKRRLCDQYPEHHRFGIHVMASQNHLGEVVIGDSHEYDDAIAPFDNPAIDRLIMDYLDIMAQFPQPEIAARWHGIYAKHPDKSLHVDHPEPHIAIVNAPGGAGMTMSFGYADRLWTHW